MSYINDQERARIRYQKLAEQRERMGAFLKLWVILSLGSLVAMIAVVVAYSLTR